MNFIKFFKKGQNKDEGPSLIGHPINVNHDMHVCKNKTTGELEGLPTIWMTHIGNQITKAEQTNNPDAVIQAVKYYNYSIRKKECNTTQGFKMFVTEKDFEEETEDIDKCMRQPILDEHVEFFEE